MRRHGFVAGFLLLPVAVYLVFVISPYVQAFQIALTDWRGVSSGLNFVGLDNFRRMFGNDSFWQAIRNHAVLLVAMPLATIALALAFAYLLNAPQGRPVRGAGFYRVVFFLPQVLAVAVVGVLFKAVYRPDASGVINGALIQLGIEPVGWLTDQTLALWSIIAVMVWQGVGFYVVLFSAGMAAIPKDVYEAAALDGAGRLTTFFRITLPLLWETVQVGWIYLGIAAFDGFALVNVLSVEQGGPDGATTVLATEIYKNAFGYSRFGYASALGVALFFLTLTFAAVTMRVTRRERIVY
ncbi:carbohydrate ABC transporter permease [Nonomuraea soli]|uniref:N-acetylglucosamine transport system permease protein n=1 Tax=Nonomuraea soli TaxID=1032476 RepID=A0A7W0HVD4_9ACTN|nr:sugar ABC transporter permease [Nonomuraea soli]MBA2896696.1 N-acetylglucosamine transport system permease protein [Nonomuraea soli]